MKQVYIKPAYSCTKIPCREGKHGSPADIGCLTAERRESATIGARSCLSWGVIGQALGHRFGKLAMRSVHCEVHMIPTFHDPGVSWGSHSDSRQPNQDSIVSQEAGEYKIGHIQVFSHLIPPKISPAITNLRKVKEIKETPRNKKGRMKKREEKRML